MKIIIICVSKYYGNTMKLANAMAPFLDARIVGTKEANDIFLDYDLVGFGSGIYFDRHHPSLFEFADKMPIVNKKGFIFSTRGRNSAFQESYHKPLLEKLTQKGFRIIGEFSCRGFSNYHKIFKLFGGVNKGHPNDREIDNAKSFAQNLLS